jgi:hypothetical protein
MQTHAGMSSSIHNQSDFVGKKSIKAFNVETLDCWKKWLHFILKLTDDNGYLVETAGTIDEGPVSFGQLHDGVRNKVYEEDRLVRPFVEGFDLPYIEGGSIGEFMRTYLEAFQFHKRFGKSL